VPEVVARLDADKNLIFTRLLNDTGHGRRGTVDVLKPAVDAFFQPDTDEAQLIQQMLSTPSEIVALAERYVKLQLEKGTNDNQEKPTQS
jgi:hypothetical protein